MDLKNKVLKYEISKKQVFEILFQVKKWQHYFVQKKRVCTRGGFFSSCKQIVRKGELFKIVRVTFETQVSEARKKNEKLTFEISMWVKKWQNYFFIQEMRTCARGSDFFLVSSKICGIMSYLR